MTKIIFFFSIETFTYLNSSIEEFSGEKVLADRWFIRMDNRRNYHTYTRDTCIPLRSAYITDNARKRLFEFA